MSHKEVTEENCLDKTKIIKNTILLYVRMAFSLLINLYCSRVVLRTLGVIDYGVYDVVGGVVVLFTMISGPLSASTTRFLTFELGTRNKERLKQVFSASMLIHLFFGIIVCLLTETIGLWFVKSVLVIPGERLHAALWVLHFSVISIFFSLLQTPLKAVVIAHERMDAFAVISLAELFLKLILVLCLVHVRFDQLITYSCMIAAVPAFSLTAYWHYGRLKFEEVRGKGTYDRGLAKDLLSFMGWSMTGGISTICNGQGLNMLLNVYFGPSVNAARGIAVQIQSALNSFSSNIQQALNPQITITYASHQLDDMHQLVVACSKFCYLFLFVLSLPIICYTPYVLTLWLGHYPPYSVEFVRMILMINLIDVHAGALITANHATGRIKMFQICVEAVTVMTFFLSFLYLRFVSSDHPIVVYYITFVISFLAQCVRIAIVLPNIKMRLSYYVRGVAVPLLRFSVLMAMLGLGCMAVASSVDIYLLIVMSCVMILLGCILAYYVALTDSEKTYVMKLRHIFINKFTR